MLYALGVGLGADPMDEKELAFVYEKNLKVVPTAATVLAAGGRGDAGRSRARPIRPATAEPDQLPDGGARRAEGGAAQAAAGEGTFTAEGRTVGACDKGKDKGAVVVNETIWTDEKGEKVATLTGSMFARGDGGFGGPSEGQPEPHPVPTRAPDLSVDIATRPDQALIYRLNGDRNPLHSDPESPRRPAFRGRSCTGCAPTASPAARCCRRRRLRLRRRSRATRPASPRPSSRARRSRSTSGRTAR